MFETDGPARPEGIHDFTGLIKKIEETFEGETESSSVHWNFANFDLKQLMTEVKVVSSKLSGISSKMVY
eukprot:2569023-Prymnesium_polylepis.1